jgi:hypothetical protein
MFLGLPVRGMVEVWIKILLPPCKNSKENLDAHCFGTLLDFLYLKNYVNVPLKVPISRIRIQDPDPNPNPLVRGMGP